MQFDQKIFEKVHELLEDGLLDYKQVLPTFLDNEEQRAELIRDVIAAANTAQRRKRNAYLIFGVRDADRKLLGIEGQYPASNRPRNWDSMSLQKKGENIGQQFLRVINEYIYPPVEIDFRFGDFEDCHLGYLEIFPIRMPDREVFQVSKDLKTESGSLLLKKGLCWRRVGESKGEPLNQKEKEVLAASFDSHYVPRRIWKEYLKNHLIASDESSIITYDESGNVVFEEIEKSANEGNTLILIEGPPGSGKTTILKQLLAKYSLETLKELESISAEEPISSRFPIYFELKKFPESGQALIDLIAIQGLELKKWLQSDEISAQLRSIFDDKTLQFTILLDGLDEVSEAYWQKTYLSIDNLIKQYPNFQIIISSRPSRVPREWQKQTTIRVSKLNIKQIEGYLIGQKLETDTVRYIVSYLKSNSKLFELVSTPLMLKPFCDYWRDFEQRQVEEQERDNKDSKIAGQVNDRLPENVKMEFEEKQLEFVEDNEENLISKFLRDVDLTDERESLSNEELVIEKPTEVRILIPSFESPEIGRIVHFLFNALFEHDKNKDLTYDQSSIWHTRRIGLGQLATYLDGHKETATHLEIETLKFALTTIEWALNIGIIYKPYSQGHDDIGFRHNLAKQYFATFYIFELIRGKENSKNVLEGIKPSKFWADSVELFRGLTFFENTVFYLERHLVPINVRIRNSVYNWFNNILGDLFIKEARHG